MADARPYRYLDEAGYHIPSDGALPGWLTGQALLLLPSTAQETSLAAAEAVAFRIGIGWPLGAWLLLDPPANLPEAGTDRTC
jgi:hypothetical protein